MFDSIERFDFKFIRNDLSHCFQFIPHEYAVAVEVKNSYIFAEIGIREVRFVNEDHIVLRVAGTYDSRLIHDQSKRIKHIRNAFRIFRPCSVNENIQKILAVGYV